MTDVSPTLFPAELQKRAEVLLQAARTGSGTIATAESCTGGLIAALFTEIPGSSDVFERGYVTYSNAAKAECLGVSAQLIEKHGAVSREVAHAMADGAAARARTDIAIAVTGIAGPGGGTPQKPIGLVHIAIHRKGHLTRHAENRFGDIGRAAIRLATVKEVLTILEKMLLS
ncbi:MAG TPA: CinA family protein [Hyphomicrobiaceae bacterium]|nr:CinA family protein [Hyphomicrobiaceae bacterium]